MNIIIDCPEENLPRSMTWVSAEDGEESDSLPVPAGTSRADVKEMAAGALLKLLDDCETAEERSAVMAGTIVVHAA